MAGVAILALVTLHGRPGKAYEEPTTPVRTDG